MKFANLVGQMIFVMVPMMHEKEYQHVILHGVEYGGLWVESEKLTQLILAGSDMAASRTPLVFLPYHQIKYAMAASEKLALSDRAFDV